MKRINFYFIAFLAVVVGILIFSPKISKAVRSFFVGNTAPTGSLISLASQKIHNSFSFIGSISHLRTENNNLGEKIAELEIDKSKIAELEIENRILKKELGFKDESGIKELIPARIIERDPVFFLDHFVIDKGSENGIHGGAAVLSLGTLIGLVREVYPDYSKVVLVTSKDSLVQAMLQNSRAKGILRGGISGLYLENIIQDTDYQQGEYVITSGLGGKIKQGIVIGKAGEIQSSDSGIFKSIIVNPIVDLSKLETVFIEK